MASYFERKVNAMSVDDPVRVLYTQISDCIGHHLSNKSLATTCYLVGYDEDARDKAGRYIEGTFQNVTMSDPIEERPPRSMDFIERHAVTVESNKDNSLSVTVEPRIHKILYHYSLYIP